MQYITHQLLPQKLLTKFFGALAKYKTRPIKNFLIRLFMKVYGANLQDSQIQDINEFETFNDFFVCRLKPNARNIATSTGSVVAPVDGFVYQFGDIKDSEKFHCKGFDFNLQELLAKQHPFESDFFEGQFYCQYLAPKDYHRVHMPVAGTLKHMRYIPGTLASVDPSIVEKDPKIFAKNERLCCTFETEHGPMCLIFVGAMVVASIFTVWADQINTERKFQIIDTDYSSDDIKLEKGDECGHFQLGSTVILLFPKNYLAWSSQLTSDTHLQYGHQVALQRH